MPKYSNNNLKEYFKRCFFAVDGVWFVVIEKEFDLKKALEIDRKVWEILPKIQARKIRELLRLKKNTTENLRQALEFKFQAEDYEYIVNAATDTNLEIIITSCPWLKIMEESGRKDLASQIGKAICPVEYSIWAREFNKKFQNEMKNRLCSDQNHCILHFTV